MLLCFLLAAVCISAAALDEPNDKIAIQDTLDRFFTIYMDSLADADIDCTNFVSQCVWAGYDGWAAGDSRSIKKAKIVLLL